MSRHDPYVMKIDYSRTCYNYKDLGHLVRNCKNRGIVGRERRVDYENNRNDCNLNGEENLIVLD